MSKDKVVTFRMDGEGHEKLVGRAQRHGGISELMRDLLGVVLGRIPTPIVGGATTHAAEKVSVVWGDGTCGQTWPDPGTA